MLAICRPIDSLSSVFDLLSPPDACTVLLPDSTVAALPAAIPTLAATPAALQLTLAASPAANLNSTSAALPAAFH